MILDIFSRYVVAWMVATREAHELARRLIEDACTMQKIQFGQLTIHADRGSSMTRATRSCRSERWCRRSRNCDRSC